MWLVTGVGPNPRWIGVLKEEMRRDTKRGKMVQKCREKTATCKPRREPQSRSLTTLGRKHSSAVSCSHHSSRSVNSVVLAQCGALRRQPQRTDRYGDRFLTAAEGVTQVTSHASGNKST